MRVLVILLALAGCRGDAAAVAALEERVDHLQRRLDAVESRAPTPAPELSPPAPPPATVAPRPAPHPVVRVGVDRWGVTIDGAPIATDELDAALRAAASRPGLTGVLLDVTPDVDHASVVALLDRIKGAGLGKVALATRGGPPAPEPAAAAVDEDDPLATP
ncbi:MAG: hypothetical protein JNK45_32875 [Myxococcales bacterium]|nr:hypothetical protein [Myxococcales bacterium]